MDVIPSHCTCWHRLAGSITAAQGAPVPGTSVRIFRKVVSTCGYWVGYLLVVVPGTHSSTYAAESTTNYLAASPERITIHHLIRTPSSGVAFRELISPPWLQHRYWTDSRVVCCVCGKFSHLEQPICIIYSYSSWFRSARQSRYTPDLPYGI